MLFHEMQHRRKRSTESSTKTRNQAHRESHRTVGRQRDTANPRSHIDRTAWIHWRPNRIIQPRDGAGPAKPRSPIQLESGQATTRIRESQRSNAPDAASRRHHNFEPTTPDIGRTRCDDACANRAEVEAKRRPDRFKSLERELPVLGLPLQPVHRIARRDGW